MEKEIVMLLLSVWGLLYLVSFYLFLLVYIILLLLYLNVVVILFCVLGNQPVIQLLSPIRKRNKEREVITF